MMAISDHITQAPECTFAACDGRRITLKLTATGEVLLDIDGTPPRVLTAGEVAMLKVTLEASECRH